MRILFDTGTSNIRRLLNVNDIVQNKSEDICEVLPAKHCFTGGDTTSAFVRRGKIASVRVIDKNPNFVQTLNRVGQEQYCSEALISDMEALTCAIYVGATYTNVNKLKYGMFLKKYQSHRHASDISNGIDITKTRLFTYI